MKFRVAILAFIFYCGASTLHAQEAKNIQNGLWWNDAPKSIRSGYLVGFLRGAKMSALTFNTADFCRAADHKEECHQMFEFFDYSNISYGQLVDGLTSFYTDFRNTNIHIDAALPYVRGEIRGKSADALQKQLEMLRKDATDSQYDYF